LGIAVPWHTVRMMNENAGREQPATHLLTQSACDFRSSVGCCCKSVLHVAGAHIDAAKGGITSYI